MLCLGRCSGSNQVRLAPLCERRMDTYPVTQKKKKKKEFEVEDILAHVHEPKDKAEPDNKRKFLVKWKGYGHENNTWEPFKNNEKRYRCAR